MLRCQDCRRIITQDEADRGAEAWPDGNENTLCEQCARTANGDTPVVAPIIHLNGTSKERLLDALGEAAHALRVTAYDALKETAPNGRDYYPVPGLMEKAIQQHMRRLATIDALVAEIEKQMELIEEPGR